MAELAPNMELYAVSEACIACDACCNDFGDVFKMNDDHTRAIVYAPVAKGKYDPWDIIYDCPVDAISLIKGELPPPPEGKKPASAKKKEEELPPSEITDDRPWEVRWAEVSSLIESDWDRRKRYGFADYFEETPTQYILRFAMPEKVPNHPFKFKWNLPDKMPDYKVQVRFPEPNKIIVKACLEDLRIKKLCGVANSFPDRWYREIQLPGPTKGFKENYNPQEKCLEIAIDKT
ncbi:MAG: ferredoxin [Deltaproteobacteria bacterium]|nr:ferredoxin [Deltaproteobacteria bacterium]